MQADEQTASEAKTGVLACRLPVDEIEAAKRAAAAIGESASEYVRKAILLRREGVVPKTTITSLSIGNQYLQVNRRESWTSAAVASVVDQGRDTCQV